MTPGGDGQGRWPPRSSATAIAPGPFAELHPLLAERIGASDGDELAVVSRRGRAVAPAIISRGIRPDTVFKPFPLPGQGRANSLTDPAIDPMSRMPELKVCAVGVELARGTA
ncbi:anaerobic selenocysteine-containing dehydrogenase [Streptomyces zagrosensis]|uniref:Anaerobic selenocysteine-containing dehydrogenase n=1 Tax=Streptomyces zagrosensis TaxID=1042984 RepID=A0A7W9Q5C3_9ACTN|nr:anaerobic selenocysteine-containing dehydrogenase [Streptomyces zagrosensis]